MHDFFFIAKLYIAIVAFSLCQFRRVFCVLSAFKITACVEICTLNWVYTREHMQAVCSVIISYGLDFHIYLHVYTSQQSRR